MWSSGTHNLRTYFQLLLRLDSVAELRNGWPRCPTQPIWDYTAANESLQGKLMIFRSRYTDVGIPEVPFPQFLLHRAAELSDKPALIDAPTRRTLTYAQLADGVGRVAANLSVRGMRKGDVFAIMTPNLPEFAVAFLGVLSAGGVVTTLNPLYTVNEIAHQLEDARALYLLTIPQLLDKAREADAKHSLREVFVVGEEGGRGATPFNVLLAAGSPLPGVGVNTSDIAILPYSSGTTGLPKGVILTHRNLIVGVLAAAIPLQASLINKTGLGLLPFFHIAGMVCVLCASIYSGSTLILLRSFDLESFLGTIQDYRIQGAPLVPPIVIALAKHPIVDTYDLSSLELIGSGAAPLGADVQHACSERLKVSVIQCYGMTEAAGMTHGSIEAAHQIKFGSVGPCAPNIECKVVDIVTTADLGPNQRGEVWVRGPQMMRGYLNNAEATSRCVDREGWYRTGDIGYADEDGYFYIVDRLKDLIKYKGFQIAPAELEGLLLTHPAISDAAVIASPDEEAGEVPKALVVLKGPATAKEIMSFVTARVAPYKKIRRLEFVEQIPKTSAGKILRRVLCERERSLRSEARP